VLVVLHPEIGIGLRLIGCGGGVFDGVDVPLRGRGRGRAMGTSVVSGHRRFGSIHHEGTRSAGGCRRRSAGGGPPRPPQSTVERHRPVQPPIGAEERTPTGKGPAPNRGGGAAKAAWTATRPAGTGAAGRVAGAGASALLRGPLALLLAVAKHLLADRGVGTGPLGAEVGGRLVLPLLLPAQGDGGAHVPGA